MFRESFDVEVQATSADGTEVPFTCLRSGSDSDGHLPTLVYAYGGGRRCFVLCFIFISTDLCVIVFFVFASTYLNIFEACCLSCTYAYIFPLRSPPYLVAA